MPRLRVERQPVRRVGQADGMERRDVGKRFVVKNTISGGGRGENVKAEGLMYQWDKPGPRCRRTPSDRECAADFLDALDMTQVGRRPRKVWCVRAASVSSAGKLVRL